MSRGRAKFDTTELGVVLSYYDLGVIESITEFDRGSSRSPKVGIVSERGKYVLKRRAADRAMPDRVRFAHRVQIHLADAGFPLPKLIPTQDRASTLVQIREHIYELFEFVAGQPFQRTSDEARSAGGLLSRSQHSGGDGVEIHLLFVMDCVGSGRRPLLTFLSCRSVSLLTHSPRPPAPARGAR